MADGVCCDRCGWEWDDKAPPAESGECGAHIGGHAPASMSPFIEAKRHWDAGCSHMDGVCKVSDGS